MLQDSTHGGHDVRGPVAPRGARLGLRLLPPGADAQAPALRLYSTVRNGAADTCLAASVLSRHESVLICTTLICLCKFCHALGSTIIEQAFMARCGTWSFDKGHCIGACNRLPDTC